MLGVWQVVMLYSAAAGRKSHGGNPYVTHIWRWYIRRQAGYGGRRSKAQEKAAGAGGGGSRYRWRQAGRQAVCGRRWQAAVWLAGICRIRMAAGGDPRQVYGEQQEWLYRTHIYRTPGCCYKACRQTLYKQAGSGTARQAGRRRQEIQVSSRQNSSIGIWWYTGAGSSRNPGRGSGRYRAGRHAAGAGTKAGSRQAELET